MSADQGEPSGAQANGISAADAEAAMAALSKDPKFQNILQKHMNNLSAQNAFESMPIAVKNRVRCLKNIQVDLLKLESQFYQEVQKLEARYQTLYQPLLNKRAEVVMGKYEPSQEECKWALDGEDDEGEEDKKEEQEERGPSKKGKGAAQPSTAQPSTATANGETSQDLTNGDAQEEPINGIPDFWLTTLKNCDIFGDMIFDHDELILKHLTDVKVCYPDEKGMSFTLEFHFSENDNFTNKVLTKAYIMSCEIPEDDPFSFEGASIASCTGCKIDWKKGKNVTVKTIKKKQKHKGKGQSRVVVKTVPNDSFFGFFTPPDLEALKDAEDDEDAEELTMKLETDYARAEFLRDRLLLKAVLFYTGEALEDDDEDDEMSEEEDDDQEGGDEDQDEDYNVESDLNNAKPAECKQQ